MSEPPLIPRLERPGRPVPDIIPPGFVPDFPAHAELRLIVNRPSRDKDVDDLILFDVAAYLWTRARLRGKPSFARFIRSRNLAYGGKRFSTQKIEKLFEVACKRRREALAVFEEFVRGLNRIWAED
ncbi:MAG: hypothetical protein WC713_07370 [Candidatus Methylomirabilota bacterium]